MSITQIFRSRLCRKLLGTGFVYSKQRSIIFLFSRAVSQNTLQRHRMVNAALADEFRSGLHALSLITKTPEELAKDA